MNDEGGCDSTFLHEKEDESVLLACNMQEISHEDVWYIDSGCSNHMTGNKAYFFNLDEVA